MFLRTARGAQSGRRGVEFAGGVVFIACRAGRVARFAFSRNVSVVLAFVACVGRHDVLVGA